MRYTACTSLNIVTIENIPATNKLLCQNYSMSVHISKLMLTDPLPSVISTLIINIIYQDGFF